MDYESYSKNRRNSVDDFVSKLEPDSINKPIIEELSSTKAKKKESWDNSTKPNSNQDQPSLCDRLQSKIEEMKIYKLASHKQSIGSAYESDNLDGSYVPPHVLDNSALIFTDQKKRDTMKGNIRRSYNKINFNKKEENNDDQSIVQLDNKGNKTQNYESGSDSGEGEGESSSWDWSSWLRERNADNALSLKLSQYSYVPTQNKPVIEDSSSHGYDSAEVNEDELNYYVTPRKADKFPDNLNNGTYKMGVMR